MSKTVREVISISIVVNGITYFLIETKYQYGLFEYA